ncbi:uncharacterized protein LOC106157863 [Lingula anatina]|uniref:Uncharacterized protein LOC106157863 n=1 Tax=Lingula anatina TaxID=7574 RepID=A0A1S3HST2_LINAN|nr:uncharacterized protein LOC106157863 [Lingula anatina]|eukprot:XP_013389097.1 uncharacterized protein LOC106157863 [Lingula anatina]
MPGTTPKTVQEDEMAKAKILVNTLKEKGITLLAIDFDRTIVSVHTAGAWRRGAETLAEYVRPCFKAALKAALAETLIHVCVVTYSQQPELIREVLKHALPHRQGAAYSISGD